MRVTLDSDVLIAAFATRGLCQAVVELCIEKHEILLGEDVLREVKDCFIGKLKVPSALAKELALFIEENSDIPDAGEPRDIECEDPDDIHVLGLVVKGDVECLVTGDKALLKMGRIGKTKILSPRGFWEIQQKEAG
jgi:putative PIN family toxin of toxin-antitoxin system